MKFVVYRDSFFAGFSQPLTEADHAVVLFDETKPIFDIFDEEKPDVIMTTQIMKSLLKCIGEYKTIVVLYDKDKKTLSVEDTPIEMFPMVDTHAFQLTKPSKDFECELARIGPIDNVLRKLCYPVGKFHIKIFGNDNGGGYGVAQYLGMINHQDECSLYASALLTYVDDIESALKVLMCGGCPVSVNPELESFAEIVEEDELGNLLDEWSVNQYLRDNNSQAMRKQILDHPEYTYEYLTILLLERINDVRDNKK